MNLSATIVPKSDQLNADDLMTGPRTVQITDVRAGSAEQPVSIFFEGDNGRPYKPGKSMRRVLVSIWGDDSKAYIGRSLTLYRDDSIRFGSDEVGGIRISHASDITGQVVLALTVTRGKRKPFTIERLESEFPNAWATWTLDQRGENRAHAGMKPLETWWKSLPKTDRDALASKLAGWKETAAAA